MSYAVIRDLQNQYRYEVGSSLITALQAYSQPSIEANRRILEAEYAKKNPPELLKMLQQARTDLADEKTAKSQAYAFEVTVAKEIGDMIQAEKMSAASRRKVSTRAADSAKDERDDLLQDLADAQEELLLESNAIKGVAKQLQILTPGLEVFKDVESQADLQRAMNTYMTTDDGDPDNLGKAVRKYISTTNYARNASPETKLEFDGKELGGLTVANIEEAFINKFAPVASYGGTELGAGDEGAIAASLFDSAKKTIEGTYADRITAGATVPMRSEAQIEADVRARFAKGGEEIEKAAKLREESIAIKEAEVKRLEDMYKGVATGSARTPEQVLMQDYGVGHRFDTPFYDPQPARTMKEPRDPREPRERVEREAREKAERETRERVERDRQRRFGRVPDPVAPAAFDDFLDDEPAVVEDSLLDEVLISEEEEKRDIIANIMLMDPKYASSEEDMASLQKAPIAALRDLEGQIQRDLREKGKSVGRGGKIIDTTTTDGTLRGFALTDKERSDRISLIGTAEDPYGTKRDPGTGLPVEDLAIIQEVMDAFPLDLDEDIVFGDRKLNLGPTASSVDIDLELLDEMGEREPIEIGGTPLSEINPKLNERYKEGRINRQEAIREAKTRLLFELLPKDETSDEEIPSSFEKENAEEKPAPSTEELDVGWGTATITKDSTGNPISVDVKDGETVYSYTPEDGDKWTTILGDIAKARAPKRSSVSSGDALEKYNEALQKYEELYDNDDTTQAVLKAQLAVINRRRPKENREEMQARYDAYLARLLVGGYDYEEDDARIESNKLLKKLYASGKAGKTGTSGQKQLHENYATAATDKNPNFRKHDGTSRTQLISIVPRTYKISEGLVGMVQLNASDSQIGNEVIFKPERISGGSIGDAFFLWSPYYFIVNGQSAKQVGNKFVYRKMQSDENKVSASVENQLFYAKGVN